MNNPSSIAALVMATALAGCATAVPKALPPQMVPHAFAAPSTGPVWPKVSWWQGFGDAELTSLVDEAARSNQDLAIAASRVLQAEAQATVQRAALFPQIGA